MKERPRYDVIEDRVRLSTYTPIYSSYNQSFPQRRERLEGTDPPPGFRLASKSRHKLYHLCLVSAIAQHTTCPTRSSSITGLMLTHSHEIHPVWEQLEALRFFMLV